MGRYYQTAAPEFVQDIMYRPPWELAKGVLQKEQGDYDTAVAKTSLYGDVDMQHMDTPAEIENAQRIQQAYAQKSDALLEQLQAAGTDWRKAMPGLTKLGRELSADFKTGDISKLENSAAQYAAMNKHLETIKDPATKERAKQAYLDKFNQQARGSLDGVFSYDQTYDKKDLTGEFLAEKKNWDDPDITSAISQWKKDGYINTKTTSTKKLEKLKQAFGDFVKAKGYEPYMQQQQQFGLGNYFDPETGQLMNVDDKRSSLSSMGDYAAQGEYKQVAQNIESKQDIIAAENRAHSWEEYMGSKAAKTAMLSGPTKEAIVNSQQQIDILNKEFGQRLNNIGNQIGARASAPGGRLSINDVWKALKKARSNPRATPATLKKLEVLSKELQETGRMWVGNKTQAGFAPFANTFGVENAESAQKQFSTYTADPRALYPVKGDLTIRGKVIPDTSITDLLAHPENKKYGLHPDEIARIKGIAKDANGDLVDKQGYKDYYVQGSEMPVMVSEDPSEWRYNDMKMEYNIEGIPISQQSSFEKLGIGMAQNASQKRK
jgi:hypothetical protein